MLSVIIPARNEKYLQRTIQNVLDNAEGEIEIIAVLDGYWPDPPIQDDKRVILIHHAEAIGQRQSINEAARIAKGKYIMKLDAHCAVDKGFDVKLAADCEYDWTVVPRMYNLDHETWEPKRHKLTDYMYIGLRENGELRAEYFDKGLRQPNNANEIDDVMCCMGPCFFMHKDRFWELGGMDEGHGGWGQMGIEVACKAWLSGGAFKVNKKTWFAHWFRGGGGPGFPYSLGGREVDRARKYSKDLWINNKWPMQKRTFDWMIQKFNPPGWENEPVMGFDKGRYYQFTINNKRRPIQNRFAKWFGANMVKYPTDVMMYQEIIFENKPDFIIETGTKWGGSALFFAHLCELMGHGQVITIDTLDFQAPKHPRITHIIGRSTSEETLNRVKEIIGGGTVMVSLDSSHSRPHVKREMKYYGAMVTTGQYMVVEDTNYPEIGGKDGPDEAVKWYMRRNNNFKVVPLENKWIYSCNPGGWLRRV